MPTTYKILGQSSPTLNSNVTVYTCPAGNNAVTSTMTICNLQSTGPAALSIGAVQSGQTLANLNYITRNTLIASNDTLILTLGMTLNAGDFLTANANVSTLAITVFGSETY
jgi:hypothetical protein